MAILTGNSASAEALDLNVSSHNLTANRSLGGGELTHRLDAGKTRFRKLIAGGTSAQPQLPMVHSTDTYVLEDVLDDGSIGPQECKVFGGEQLTYLFYGRPAFRTNADAEPSALGHYSPVCLIFKPEWNPAIKRIFPFDSGAFENRLYDAFLHKKMKLGDFSLEPDIATPGRIVQRFFGSAGAYLVARGSNPAIDPSEFEAQSYSALIHSRAGNAIDSRGSGIEVQTAEAITLTDALDAVILPMTFSKGTTGKALRRLKIDTLPYKTYDNYRPSEYMSAITDICFTYYIRKKLIRQDDL